ncbi:hypothetical protein [Mucilaginibacter psychrotolerans]|uniref:T9SS C-terminal target domain-containing protein n=1 Tax=Mucilaginibacter psychrotolerans TaxID=1524096 RepID=A0A4Y8SL30_9SPHI|nr:hypothetical protein [Mucilaginibacter psychrotolerans]TFF39753.1 hypothetical protein E2R66_05140 [Mucilaginibacter psychrotolerans]
MKAIKGVLLLTLLNAGIAWAQDLKLPVREPEVLKAKYTFDYWGKLELSGIVRSRTDKNVFWMQNDSGDQPRVFAIDSLGKFYQSARYRNYEGITIAGATNVDWEDIAVDDKGNLIIADIGNNYNDRRDLVLYVVPEPSPIASNTTFLKKLFFKYPDQKVYNAKTDFNYDCEAVFFADGKFHMLSKDRMDTFTRLYRMDVERIDEVNTLTLLDKFNIGGKVTAADCTEDGDRLVVITYRSIWIFERTGPGSSWFNGNIYWLPVKAPQIESVCFKDDKTLWLLDEETAALYEVPTSKLVKVK